MHELEGSLQASKAPRRPVLHRLAERVGQVEALDPPAQKLLGVADRLIKPGRARDALSGTFLGHALHPLMTDLPIGSWTSAVLRDNFGGRESEGAARRLIRVGILAAVPTAATGYVEWADSAGGRASTRRVGLAQAASNVTALSLFTASHLARKRGRRAKGGPSRSPDPQPSLHAPRRAAPRRRGQRRSRHLPVARERIRPAHRQRRARSRLLAPARLRSQVPERRHRGPAGHRPDSVVSSRPRRVSCPAPA